MLALGQTVLPNCRGERRCSDVCSQSISLPRPPLCSPSWSREYDVQTRRARVSRGNCSTLFATSFTETTYNLSCLFADCAPDSPCASSLYATGDLLAGSPCEAEVTARCRSSSSSSICKSSASGCPSTGWYDCVTAGTPSVIEDAARRYSMIPTPSTRMLVSADAFVWTSNFGCDSRKCPCVKHRSAGGGEVEAVACVTSRPLSQIGAPLVTFANTFVIVLLPLLALVLSAHDRWSE